MTNPVVSGSAAPRYEWKQSGGFIFKVKILAMHRIANAVQVGAFFVVVFFLWGGICGWGVGGGVVLFHLACYTMNVGIIVDLPIVKMFDR